jgi:acetylornithine deacetylase/succinyl-diaminopimelate desuccinylase-like protein
MNTTGIMSQHLRLHGAEIIARYAEFLRFPNVTSDSENIRRFAQFICGQYSEDDVRMELLELPGANPIVYGELESPNASRTIVLYAHYDAAAVEESEWSSTTPWDPALFSGRFDEGGVRLPWPDEGTPIDPEWRIYARAAADDKVSIFAMLEALRAIIELELQRTSNIIFFFDGEEEVSSENLVQFMKANRKRLGMGDVWLFCDGPMHPSRHPTLYFGARGYTGVDITVFGANRDLHSGHYGNWAPNPALELARLLSSMKDPEGNVLIEGFYDLITPLSDAERLAIDRIPPIDELLSEELELHDTEGQNQTYHERMLLPSLNIRGLESASVGESARNIIPKEATVSIDMRLVKDIDPETLLDAVEAHVRKQGFYILRNDPSSEIRRRHSRIAKIVRRPSDRAARTRMDDPHAIDVLQTLEHLFPDTSVAAVPTLGGTLPLYLICELFEKPLIILPFSNHDNNQHAPDENLRIGNLWYAIDVMSAILTMSP